MSELVMAMHILYPAFDKGDPSVEGKTRCSGKREPKQTKPPLRNRPFILGETNYVETNFWGTNFGATAALVQRKQGSLC